MSSTTMTTESIKRHGDAQPAFERFLAARDLRCEALTIPVGMDAMLAFYSDVRASFVDLDGDGDMLLFQFGTYDLGRGRHFRFDLTRQLRWTDDEDDDRIYQLHLTFLLTPTPASDALGRGNRWCRSPERRDDLRAFIVASPAYAAACDASDLRVELRGGFA
jgi:hypothetical protein